MKTYTIISALCLAASVVGNAEPHISPMASLPDGSQVEIANHYFLVDEWPTLTIADSDVPVTWEVKSYEYAWPSPKNNPDPMLMDSYISENPSLSFEIPHEQIQWRRQYFWFDDEDETHSELEVYAKVNGEVIDQINLKFRLAPSQIEVIDVYLEYDHNWTLTEWGDWEDEDGGIHMAVPHYTLKVKRCDVIEIGWSYDICIHDYLLFRYGDGLIRIFEDFYPPRAQVEGDIWTFKRDIETSWGEWFTFEARNEYGAITFPKILCTTDYFTDPDIIEQIQRYYEEDKYLAKVDEVTVEPEDDAPCQYFNLQGLPITSPRKGEIVIRLRGSKTDKIVY